MASRWTLLRKCRDSHKWFSDSETGRVACADYSGRFPDQTDDGILWLNKERPIVMARSEGRIYVTTPVLQNDKPKFIISSLDEIIYLMQEHGMKIEVQGVDAKIVLMTKLSYPFYTR